MFLVYYKSYRSINDLIVAECSETGFRASSFKSKERAIKRLKRLIKGFKDVNDIFKKHRNINKKGKTKCITKMN